MNRVSPLEKLYYVRLYLSGEGVSQQQCADQAGVSKTAFQHWLRKYAAFGAEGFTKKTYTHYSEETRKAAVEDYRSGALSQKELCEKYQLASMRQIYDWNQRYGKQSESPSDSGLKAETLWTEGAAGGSGQKPAIWEKGRATTWNERVEIVAYCLAHDRDYRGTAAKYQVSYQQVYTWVRRYDVGGEEHLRFAREKKAK